MFTAVLQALGMAFAMGWEILWPLILGFALSAVIQATVSRREMSRLLPDDSPRSLGIALALGAPWRLGPLPRPAPMRLSQLRDQCFAKAPILPPQ